MFVTVFTVTGTVYTGIFYKKVFEEKNNIF